MTKILASLGALLMLAGLVTFSAPQSASARPHCGRHGYWVPPHRGRDGRWIPGHCRYR